MPRTPRLPAAVQIDGGRAQICHLCGQGEHRPVNQGADEDKRPHRDADVAVSNLCGTTLAHRFYATYLFQDNTVS